MTPPAARATAIALVALACLGVPHRLAAQSLTVRAAGDMLQVRGSGLRLIESAVAEHLKDGRSVRVDFEMTILDKAQGAAVTQNRQSFVLSFDLWEQRYAVTRTGAAPRSISHLTARDAEAWCVENLSIPLTALGRFSRDLPFWVRVEFRVQDQPPPPDDTQALGPLRTLIEVFSRRGGAEALDRSFVAGPFRIGN